MLAEQKPKSSSNKPRLNKFNILSREGQKFLQILVKKSRRKLIENFEGKIIRVTGKTYVTDTNKVSGKSIYRFVLNHRSLVF